MQVVELFKIYDIHVSILIFRAESNRSINRIAQSHLQGAGGQVNQGHEGVHHVGCQVVQTGQQGEFKDVLNDKRLDIYLKNKMCSANVDLTDIIENGTAEDAKDTFEA